MARTVSGRTTPDPVDALRKAAAVHGLQVVEKGIGHFQIVGGVLLVNYYPESRQRTAYIQGMAASHKHVTPEAAVLLSVQPNGLPGRGTRRRRGGAKYRKKREKLYLTIKNCYRCGLPMLTFADTSLEHKVPLSQGGLDNINNMTLSHPKCNHEAGNKMPRGIQGKGISP